MDPESISNFNSQLYDPQQHERHFLSSYNRQQEQHVWISQNNNNNKIFQKKRNNNG